MVNETLTTTEAAEILKVHTKTVGEMIATGELPAGRFGKSYVILRRDVLELVERRITRDTARRMGLMNDIRPIRRRSHRAAVGRAS